MSKNALFSEFCCEIVAMLARRRHITFLFPANKTDFVSVVGLPNAGSGEVCKTLL